MAGWIMTETANGAADIHKNSGIFTYGNTLCPGVPSNCEGKEYYSVKAILEEDIDNFDGFHTTGPNIGFDKNVEQEISAKGCNCDGFIMWFNKSPNTQYNILTNNTIFDMKNVDECEHIVIGTPITGTQTFEQSTYEESGYPDVGRATGTTNGHKIKYRPKNASIPSDFYTNKDSLVELYFPRLLDTYPYPFDNGYNIEGIGNGAFSGCSDLSAITFSVVKTIGNSAFKGCTKLQNIDWGYNRSGSSCKIISKITNIGGYAFSGCTSITDLDLKQLRSVTSIGEGAFNNCTSVTALTLPTASTYTEVSQNCFYGLQRLETFIIPTNITTIRSNGFNFGFNVSASSFEIDVPSSVTTIEDSGLVAMNPAHYTFKLNWSASQLANVTMGHSIFAPEGNTPYSIEIPSGTLSAYTNLFNSAGNNNYVGILVEV